MRCSGFLGKAKGSCGGAGLQTRLKLTYAKQMQTEHSEGRARLKVLAGPKYRIVNYRSLGYELIVILGRAKRRGRNTGL